MAARRTKGERIYDELLRQISGGVFPEGARFPSEATLANRFGASRPTIAKALNRLEESGLLVRRPGSGSFVNPPKQTERMFGLFIPNLGDTEILDPIYNQIMTLAEHTGFSILLGAGLDRAEHIEVDHARQVCDRFLEKGVAGVFFVPYELTSNASELNRYVTASFEAAAVPIVLIDRDIVSFPERSRYDLVGMDNFRAGWIMANHLLRRAAERVDFILRPYSASTQVERILGYQEALRQAGLVAQPTWVQQHSPTDREFVEWLIRHDGARSFVCGNDSTAADLISTLDSLGIEIPGEVRIVAFDDVKYAKLLRVPLTTYHQPCPAIGTMAVRLLLERLDDPTLAPRRVLLDGELVVRASCGVERTLP